MARIKQVVRFVRDDNARDCQDRGAPCACPWVTEPPGGGRRRFHLPVGWQRRERQPFDQYLVELDVYEPVIEHHQGIQVNQRLQRCQSAGRARLLQWFAENFGIGPAQVPIAPAPKWPLDGIGGFRAESWHVQDNRNRTQYVTIMCPWQAKSEFLAAKGAGAAKDQPFVHPTG